MSEITKEQFVNTAGQFFRTMIEQEEQIKQLQAEVAVVKKDSAWANLARRYAPKDEIKKVESETEDHK